MTMNSKMVDMREYKLYLGDCLEVMKGMDDNSVDAVITDPPFNIGKVYNSYDDNAPISKYKEWCYEWIDECVRVMKEGAILSIHQIPEHALWMGAYLQERLDFISLVAWKANTWPMPHKMTGTNYSFLLFSKGKRKTWNSWGDVVPHARCRHCDGLIADWGGKEKLRKPEGSRVTDVWTDIQRIRHTKNKTRVANELPVSIPERFIKLYTNKDDVVLDIFMGSGTTGVACAQLGRKFIGIEIDEEYYKIAEKRIELAYAQKVMF